MSTNRALSCCRIHKAKYNDDDDDKDSAADLKVKKMRSKSRSRALFGRKPNT